MINKPLDKIALEDLEILVQNCVAEGKSMEFKLLLPGNSDKDKKEFLADVSSFANTLGGDLIFGIREEKGIARKIEGITVINVDEEIRKYDNLIRDGIEPRIQVTIKPVKVDGEKGVFIFRVNKSWIGPHRVIFQGHDKFYARNSGGKYPLDTGELRVSFSLSNTLTDRIRQFKNERIAAVIADDTPVLLNRGGKIILHLIPLEAFSPNVSFAIRLIQDLQSKLQPIYSSGWNHRQNLEGILIYAGNRRDQSRSYVQLYRNGIIEAVEGHLLRYDRETKQIPSIAYERELLKSLPKYLTFLKELGVNPPIFLFLTISGAKGFKMAVSHDRFEDDGSYPIDRDPLLLPESLIEAYDVDPKEMLRPIFDLIWNACGFERSFNFDENGEWINDRYM